MASLLKFLPASIRRPRRSGEEDDIASAVPVEESLDVKRSKLAGGDSDGESLASKEITTAADPGLNNPSHGLTPHALSDNEGFAPDSPNKDC